MIPGLLGTGFLANKLMGGDPTKEVPDLPDFSGSQNNEIFGTVQDQSRRSEGDLLASQLAGAKGAGAQFLDQDSRFDQGLGGNDPALSDALKKRSSRAFSSNYSNLEKQLKSQAPSLRMNRLMTPQEKFAQHAMNDVEIAKMKMGIETQKYAARANTIKGILNFGGAVGGGLMGGMQGAQVGGQLGGAPIGMGG